MEKGVWVWADGRARFPGETRLGFDSATGKRLVGRPRKQINSKEFEKNITGSGLFAKLIVHIMIPRLEHYVLDGKVDYIEISSAGVNLVLNDFSKVRV